MSNMAKWFRFYFADGYVCECRGFSTQERKIEERKHGKIIHKIFIGSF